MFPSPLSKHYCHVDIQFWTFSLPRKHFLPLRYVLYQMCFIMGDQGKTHHKSLIIRSLFRVSPGAALHRHAKLSTRRVTNWISFNNGAIKTLEPVCPSSSQQPTELKPPARNQDRGVTQPSLSLVNRAREDLTVTKKAPTRSFSWLKWF